MKTVLVISPHTDDAELGAGGYLARLVEEGASVHVVALSDCRASVPAGMPAGVLRAEAAAARDLLGVTGEVLGFPVRHFPMFRQEILETLVRLGRERRPDLVLCPSPADKHQDHAATAAECLRAFRCSVWGWLLPWNVTDYSARGFVRLEERHLAAKLTALACYESQAVLGRPYMDPEAVRAWARTTGLMAGCAYAEAFDTPRTVS